MEDLPPPPPIVPPNVKPEVVALAPPKHSIMVRPRGSGTTGRRIQLSTNHFKVSVKNPDAVFYQYSVLITYEDKRPVEGMGLGRKLVDKLYQTYSSEFAGKKFAYDGEKALYTVGPLPRNKLEFTVVLEESFTKSNKIGKSGETDKRMKHCSNRSKTFNVEISYAAKITFKSIALALQGAEVDNTQDALRVLDIILRQKAAKMGCLLVRQSFFHDDSRNFVEIGGGVTGVRGFHSSFRPTQGGMSLNMDVSTTMIVTPGPVIDFLLTNQGVREPRYIDWVKAKRMLKNMRITTRHRNMECKITGLSEKTCNNQLFNLKLRSGDGMSEGETVEITVYEYFVKHCGIELTYSQHMPCLDVGKPKRPTYVPVELCSLVSLQRYTKALSSQQRASLVEKSRQKPLERIKSVTDALRNYRYDEDPVLAECGISIEKQLIQMDGRILETPKLKVGGNEDMMPFKGRWNFKGKSFLDPTRINSWLAVNFSGLCDLSQISRELINVGKKTGIHIERPKTLIEEDPRAERLGPVARVDKMFEQIQAKLQEPPEFILCVIPKKGSDIYGPWKKKTLVDFGIPTQCISPPKLSDPYLTNVLMKINTKLGGINSLLALEYSSCVPLINDTPTMILGMDVSHGSPGRSDIPSVAAVVGSRSWPLISRYRAAVRTQSPKVEMIDGLYKPLPNGNDDGIIRELLLDFYNTSKGRKPTQIIVFRDGVSESQFNQVLNIELDQIVKAYQNLGEENVPKFTLIIAQKNHHTKLFQANSPDNVPPGTVVDTKIVHPRIYDFYMCAQAGMIGTSRPAHYHVLLDEIGFSPDDLQNLIHSLSYVYQRSCTAISIVAPICYAHLAAAQVGQFMKFEDLSETSSAKGSVTTSESIPVPELPRLHRKVQGSMFFC
ncbi:putative post-transcriptional gene silencing PAZ-Argonaute family [Rosa chinensis]|uniref:Putative post-transcriptional gene silencing PAZ-Argonaute family n=1 Tax=Rosa chinensis TaxID=74649 RepID=A0A2P6S1V7_ROSCH|nr:protein argonaute 16 [Rosa chinensis]PRQ52668.1 putative post-transcriptional gene silencing PAZ-Argonaute family [Rosa chinensis]